MKNTISKTSPLARLFRFVRENGERIMSTRVEFNMSASELAECIVWTATVRDGVEPSEEWARSLRLTAKLAKDSAERFVWSNGHPLAADRDLDSAEERAMEIVAERIVAELS